jgi:hypothetical protein
MVVNPVIGARALMVWGNTVKRVIGIVLAAVFVLGAVAFFLVRSAEDKVTEDMLARAGRFAIPSDWKLTDEVIRPEQFLCMSTNPCPSLYRQWDTGKELTANDLTAVVSGVGFEIKTDRLASGNRTPSASPPSADPPALTATTPTCSTPRQPWR